MNSKSTLDNEALWCEFQKDRGRFEVTRPRQECIADLIVPQARVLNIGVGGGLLEEMLTKKGVSLSIMDLDAAMIQKMALAFSLGDRARVGSIESIPFPDAEFDYVICSEIFEHLEDRVLRTGIRVCARVLRIRGHLLGTTPAREQLEAARVFCPDCRKNFHPLGHVRSFDAAGLSRELSTDFDDIQVAERLFIDTRRVRGLERMRILMRQFGLRLGRPTAGSNFFFTGIKKELV